MAYIELKNNKKYQIDKIEIKTLKNNILDIGKGKLVLY